LSGLHPCVMDQMIRAMIVTISGIMTFVIPFLFAYWLTTDIRRKLAAAVITSRHNNGIGVPMTRRERQRHQEIQQRERLISSATASSIDDDHAALSSVMVPPSANSLIDNNEPGTGDVSNLPSFPSIAVAVPVSLPAAPIVESNSDSNNNTMNESDEVRRVKADGHMRIWTCHSWVNALTFVVWPLILLLTDATRLYTANWHDDYMAMRVTYAQWHDRTFNTTSLGELVNDGITSIPIIGSLDGLVWVIPPLFAQIGVRHLLLSIQNTVAATRYTHRSVVLLQDSQFVLGALGLALYYYDAHVILFGTGLNNNPQLATIILTTLFVS
jgi:hypothetical protein